jgi:multidrug efflux pump subunit AcrB
VGGFFSRFHASFERGFGHLREGYVGLLTILLTRRAIVPILAVLVLSLGAVMFVFVGRDFYPAIDSGMIQLHVRAPPGTRIEMTAQIFQKVEEDPPGHSPKGPGSDRRQFGVPARSYNWAFSDGNTIAVNDGVIMVSLKDGDAPTADYVRKLRRVLPAAFPADMFYFQPADMATQILHFGLTAPIDVRTVGYDRVKNLQIAEELRRRIAAIPGIVDAHLQQEVYAPDFFVKIDRARALQFGINANDIGNNITTSLSSSEQVQPNFWTDPHNGIPYYIAVQTPQYLVSSLNDLGNTPVSTLTAPPATQPVPGELGNEVWCSIYRSPGWLTQSPNPITQSPLDRWGETHRGGVRWFMRLPRELCRKPARSEIPGRSAPRSAHGKASPPLRLGRRFRFLAFLRAPH